MESGTYLIHFDSPIDRTGIYIHYGDISHYVGYSENIDKRIRQHLRGKGSTMTRTAIKQGIVIREVRRWLENVESVINKNAKSHCPICNP